MLMSTVEKQEHLAQSISGLPWQRGVSKTELLDHLQANRPVHDLLALYLDEGEYRDVDAVIDQVPAGAFAYVPGEESRMGEIIGELPQDRVVAHEAGRPAERDEGTANAEAETSGLAAPEGTPNPGQAGDRPRGPGDFAEDANPPPVYDL